MWSFGCLVFEFLTGHPLFNCELWRSDQEALNGADDDQLLQVIDILGLEPGRIERRLENAKRQHTLDAVPYPTLDEQFRIGKNVEIGSEEAVVVCGLIRRILAFEPHERPTAQELLEHPWFNE